MTKSTILKTHCNDLAAFQWHTEFKNLINVKSQALFFLLLLSTLFSATFAKTDREAFQCHPHNSHENDDEKANDIQAVVLDPVQVMCCNPQVGGTFMSHDKLSPENSEFQRLNRAVEVDFRYLHYVLFVAEKMGHSIQDHHETFKNKTNNLNICQNKYWRIADYKIRVRSFN